MKIAIINYSSSGLFHYATCLANALAKNGENQLLFITSQFNNLELLESTENLRLVAQPAPHSIPGFIAWLANPNQQLRLYREIENFDPDIIHITDSHAVYVPHQLWLKKRRIVFTQHDPLIHPGDVYPIASRIIHRTQQHLATKIVTHGKQIKQTLVSRGIASDRVAVIPHGEYSFYLRWRKPNITPKENSILFFGRIVQYKGLDILLDSLLKLQQENISTSLMLAGSGGLDPYRVQLDKLTNKTVHNRHIPDEEVIHYFQQATMLVMPYREASQSGIMSIALPAGLPIIATRVGAIPEILINNHNSLLIEPNDVKALTAAIKRLLANKTLREKISQGALATAADKLSWEQTAKQYYHQYQSIL